MTFAGVVTLYNPEDIVADNIKRYVEHLDVVFIVENSETINQYVLSEIKQYSNIKILNNRGNKGVAYALNRAAKRATALKMDWLLMMDQDSTISCEMLEEMKEFICGNKDERVGIVAANYRERYIIGKKTAQIITYENQVITSGSLININVYKNCGDFLNQLFIDEVDFEYCLRLRKFGYRIIKLNYVLFEHNLGYPKKLKNLVMYNYPPFRYYYIVRNSLYVSKLYKNVFPELCVAKERIIGDWILRVLKEEKTLLKIIYMLKGYLDFKIGRMGKLK